ncbi:DUF5522 domain-containing protein [Persicitalea jodogahamensis]|uniref:DUF5522 domain-containing protein n=1 Tax=Persicitalea jodogahamensis TaxID=402147 RepID=UPI001675AABC|nr:DUF5522 domain-containing protein [Persicitalea jodogahamensis]
MSYRVPPPTRSKPGTSLSEEDFYINKEGFMVFTAIYHRKRGYCCQSGCLHCPYGFRKTGGDSK